MTQGAQSLHLLGSKASTNNMALDVNATNAVQHLKQEVIKLQAENKKLTDQLNCFISLVQRSWKGDKFATTHLSNIVGLDPPPKQISITNDGTQARPNSQIDPKNRSQMNWERLTNKLLDREYQAVQEEIREYQQRYIQNRQLYMDAVLYDHQQSMSAIPLSRRSSNPQNVEDLDARFIRHTKAIERMGGSHRQKRRAQTAKVRRTKTVQDQVQGMDISLRDLVGETPSSNHFSTAEAPKESYIITPSQNLGQRPHSSYIKRYPSNTYSDPDRYAQGDLYGLKDTDEVRRPRPVSASSLREGDSIRSRPRTGSIGKTERKGSQVFLTQKTERSLKYEATKPVYIRPKSSKPRQKSAQHRHGNHFVLKRSNSHTGLTTHTNFIPASGAHVSVPNSGTTEYQQKPEPLFQNGDTMPNVQDTLTDYVDSRGNENTASEDAGLPPKPSISVRVKSAFTQRPAHIDQFAEEERKMRELEEDFKKTALGLQKKLGIEDRGMVILD